MIAALLALVIIALTIISVASLSQFSGYLQNQSGIQVSSLFAGRMDALNASRNPTNFGPGWHGLSTGDFGYYGPLMVELLDTKGQVFESFGPSSQYGPGPAVPVSGSWLQANSGKLVTVPGQDGNASWQVMVKETTVSLTNPFTDQISAPQTVILVAGTSLANIDSTVGWLRRIDLLVSVIIVLALVVVGIAIVRASLRPLTDIEETAEAIAAGDLSRRVPDWDPRTEVGRLGRSLNTMLSQIESSFEARARSEAAARRSEERMRQFVADASHELRTPLTAMRGYAEYYRQRGGCRTTTPDRPRMAPARAVAAGSAGRTWTGSCSGSSRKPAGWESWSRRCCCSPGWTSSGRSSAVRSTCSPWPPTRCRTPGSSRRPGKSS